MALASRPKKETQRIGIKKSKNMLYSGTSLASAESLTVPLVQVVVLSADIRCAECQRRVADIMSRMNEVETHMIEKQQCRISVCGRFRPSI
uniref:HMA domain-containing protein n=1 Tax=Populus trichocarpa TaxID=3694 RepID=A0A2K1YT61_POPTR